MGREHRVEGVYAFDDEYVVVGELQRFAALLRLACFKVEARGGHGLARNEAVDVVAQSAAVHGVDVLEVVVPLRIEGRAFAVYKVVVGGEGHWAQSAHPQLHRESLAEGRLAARRRAGNQHDAAVGERGYAVGHAGDALFLQGF